MRELNKDFFKDKELVKATKRTNSQRYLNGQLVDVNTVSFKVQNAAQILRQNNVLPNLQGGYGQDSFQDNTGYGGKTFRDVTDGESQLSAGEGHDEFSNTVNTAIAVLSAIGVTPIYNQERDFSFLKTQEMTPLRNPNIIEEDRLKSLKNKNIKTDDNFKDSSNPFYNLDEGMSEAKYKQIKQLKGSSSMINPTNTAAAIFDLNIVNTTTNSLRQLK